MESNKLQHKVEVGFDATLALHAEEARQLAKFLANPNSQINEEKLRKLIQNHAQELVKNKVSHNQAILISASIILEALEQQLKPTDEELIIKILTHPDSSQQKTQAQAKQLQAKQIEFLARLSNRAPNTIPTLLIQGVIKDAKAGKPVDYLMNEMKRWQRYLPTTLFNTGTQKNHNELARLCQLIPPKATIQGQTVKQVTENSAKIIRYTKQALLQVLDEIENIIPNTPANQHLLNDIEEKIQNTTTYKGIQNIAKIISTVIRQKLDRQNKDLGDYILNLLQNITTAKSVQTIQQDIYFLATEILMLDHKFPQTEDSTKSKKQNYSPEIALVLLQESRCRNDPYLLKHALSIAKRITYAIPKSKEEKYLTNIKNDGLAKWLIKIQHQKNELQREVTEGINYISRINSVQQLERVISQLYKALEKYNMLDHQVLQRITEMNPQDAQTVRKIVKQTNVMSKLLQAGIQSTATPALRQLMPPKVFAISPESSKVILSKELWEWVVLNYSLKGININKDTIKQEFLNGKEAANSMNLRLGTAEDNIQGLMLKCNTEDDLCNLMRFLGTVAGTIQNKEICQKIVQSLKISTGYRRYNLRNERINKSNIDKALNREARDYKKIENCRADRLITTKKVVEEMLRQRSYTQTQVQEARQKAKNILLPESATEDNQQAHKEEIQKALAKVQNMTEAQRISLEKSMIPEAAQRMGITEERLKLVLQKCAQNPRNLLDTERQCIIGFNKIAQENTQLKALIALKMKQNQGVDVERTLAMLDNLNKMQSIASKAKTSYNTIQFTMAFAFVATIIGSSVGMFLGSQTQVKEIMALLNILLPQQSSRSTRIGGVGDAPKITAKGILGIMLVMVGYLAGDLESARKWGNLFDSGFGVASNAELGLAAKIDVSGLRYVKEDGSPNISVSYNILGDKSGNWYKSDDGSWEAQLLKEKIKNGDYNVTNRELADLIWFYYRSSALQSDAGTPKIVKDLAGVGAALGFIPPTLTMEYPNILRANSGSDSEYVWSDIIWTSVLGGKVNTKIGGEEFNFNFKFVQDGNGTWRSDNGLLENFLLKINGFDSDKKEDREVIQMVVDQMAWWKYYRQTDLVHILQFYGTGIKIGVMMLGMFASWLIKEITEYATGQSGEKQQQLIKNLYILAKLQEKDIAKLYFLQKKQQAENRIYQLGGSKTAEEIRLWQPRETKTCQCTNSTLKHQRNGLLQLLYTVPKYMLDEEANNRMQELRLQINNATSLYEVTDMVLSIVLNYHLTEMDRKSARDLNQNTTGTHIAKVMLNQFAQADNSLFDSTDVHNKTRIDGAFVRDDNKTDVLLADNTVILTTKPSLSNRVSATSNINKDITQWMPGFTQTKDSMYQKMQTLGHIPQEQQRVANCIAKVETQFAEVVQAAENLHRTHSMMQSLSALFAEKHEIMIKLQQSEERLEQLKSGCLKYIVSGEESKITEDENREVIELERHILEQKRLLHNAKTLIDNQLEYANTGSRFIEKSQRDSFTSVTILELKQKCLAKQRKLEEKVEAFDACMKEAHRLGYAIEMVDLKTAEKKLVPLGNRLIGSNKDKSIVEAIRRMEHPEIAMSSKRERDGNVRQTIEATTMHVHCGGLKNSHEVNEKLPAVSIIVKRVGRDSERQTRINIANYTHGRVEQLLR